ncbi:MAG: hypothetical protein KGL53_15765 [Elusimicrobia bacterium]|nr:hypothetical protein [Elusimicrobiota bacterium]
MASPEDYRAELETLAARALEVLRRPGNAGGRTAWELKMELKASHTAVFAALGMLLERKAVSLAPQDLTVLAKPAGAAIPQAPSTLTA